MANALSSTENPVQRLLLNLYRKYKNSLLVTTETVPLSRSYLFMRTGVGILAVALPFAVLIGKLILESPPSILDSLSSSYYSVMRDVFVGNLWAIGIFLICYRYDRLDDLVSTFAGLFAIMVSLFPTTPEKNATQQQMIIGNVHAFSAMSLLLILACMSIFLFRRTNQVNRERRKRQRDAVYLICGYVIFACIGLSALYLFVPVLHDASWLKSLHPIFLFESLAIFSFGASWFVKGGSLILKDEQNTNIGTDPNFKIMTAE